jgi:hypothetical protein
VSPGCEHDWSQTPGLKPPQSAPPSDADASHEGPESGPDPLLPPDDPPLELELVLPPPEDPLDPDSVDASDAPGCVTVLPQSSKTKMATDAPRNGAYFERASMGFPGVVTPA